MLNIFALHFCFAMNKQTNKSAIFHVTRDVYALFRLLLMLRMTQFNKHPML